MEKRTYRNPIKKKGDFADPYVMKYNGTYYLYATNADIRCWSSTNLVDWKLEGRTIEESVFPGKMPFAPEVVYHNGEFYMYTSPSGEGHFILKSAYPTGPFVKVSDNIGHNIDGSVFMDEDGRCYFYWAHDDGIKGTEMSALDKIGEGETDTGAFLRGWTEGPMLVKRAGLYYMTYTGNHYLSSGYRVNAACSSHPLGPFKECENNPILLHSKGENIGLGHSSTVTGPDLIKDYIIYHNMNADLSRDLNIDEIKFSQGKVFVAGPSRVEQERPSLPICSLFPCTDEFLGEFSISCESMGGIEGGCRIFEGTTECRIKKSLPESGIVEVNLMANSDEYGLKLACMNLTFVREEQCLIITDIKQGSVIFRHSLYDGYRHEVLHCIKIKYRENVLELYLDNRLIKIFSEMYMDGRELSLYTRDGRMGVGYIAWNSLEEKPLLYPVPCVVYGEEEIRLNAISKGKYEIIEYASKESNVAPCIMLNKERYSPVQQFSACSRYIVPLNEGENILRVSCTSFPHPERKYFVNHHVCRCEKVSFKESLENFTGKKLLLEKCRNDSVLCIHMDGDRQGEIGFIFRACELSLGGEGNDEVLGMDFFIGYAFSIKNNRLILSKHRYDCSVLKTVEVHRGEDIRIELLFNRIRVFCDDERQARIEYTDVAPIFFGGIGIRGVSCGKVDVNISVE